MTVDASDDGSAGLDARGLDLDNCVMKTYSSVTDDSVNSTAECSQQTTFSFHDIKSAPTEAQIYRICGNEACLKTIIAIRVALPGDCYILPTQHILLHRDVLRPIGDKCGGAPPPVANISIVVPTAPAANGTRVSESTTQVHGNTSTARRHVYSILGATVGGFLSVVFALCFLKRKRYLASRKQLTRPTEQTDRDTESSTAFSSVEDAIRKSGNNVGAPWTDPHIVAARIPMEKLVIGRMLAQGAFGEVYHGTYKHQHVAIKRLSTVRRRDPGAICAFFGEAKLLTNLIHTRITTFVGVAWDALSEVAIVLEFMAGGDLRSMIAHWANPQGPNAPRTTGFDTDKLKIALHIAHALTYLHSLQPAVVHRDLKSRNVLLSEDLDAKLTDFGISREYDDDEDRTMTAGVGSSLWMAPEVMLGQRYTEKADVFSFGVLLSELDTMRLPYATEGLSEAAVLQSVCNGELSVRFTTECAMPIAALGRDCTAMDPRSRPSAGEILYRLHLLLSVASDAHQT